MAAPGIKAPKMPKGPKAPKVDPGKAGDQAKKKAAGQAKAARKKIIKRLLFILIPLLLIGIVALIMWIFVWSAPGPSAVVQRAIDMAFIEDEDKFKTYFTPDSVEALESAWSGADIGVGSFRGSWPRMMKGLLTADEMKPKIIEEELAEDGESANVIVDIDGQKRPIRVVKIDDVWLLDVNLGIDPTLVLPPEEMTAEAAEEFAMDDAENEMWWEEREAAKAAEAKESGCLGCNVLPTSDDQGRVPLDGLLFVGLGVTLFVARRRLRG